MKRKNVFALVIGLIICLAASVFAAACNKGKKVTISLDRTELTLGTGETGLITATVTGSEELPVWETSDESVATVEDGTVTAVAEGSAVISASVGKVKAECSVTVTSAALPVITLDRTVAELTVGGQSVTVTARVKYDGATVTATPEWKSSDEGVATVANGVITPVGIGTATVKATVVYNGKTAEAAIEVTVKPNVVVAVDENDVTLYTYGLSEEFPVEKVIPVTVMANGSAVSDAVVSVSGGGDAVEATLVAGGVKLAAKQAGEAEVTLSYTDKNNYTAHTTIGVSVVRPEIVLDAKFVLNLGDANPVLNLSGYDWADEIVGLYSGTTLISKSSDDKTAIASDWFASRVADTEETIIVKLENYDVKLTVQIKNDYKAIGFTLAENDGSTYVEFKGNKSEIGFQETETVYKYTGSGDNWTGRMSTENLSGFDYWILDMVIEKDLASSDQIDFWIGSNHVLVIRAGGSVTLAGNGGFDGDQAAHDKDTCLHIYENNKLVAGKIYAGRRYQFEISTRHRGKGVLFEFGVGGKNVVYIANMFACKNAYYDEYIAPYRDNTLPDVTVAVEKSDKSTFTLDFSAYSWKDEVKEICVAGTAVSVGAKLNEAWVKQQAAGSVEAVIRLNDGTEIGLIITITSNRENAVFAPADGAQAAGGDFVLTQASDTKRQAMGFGNDTVYEYAPKVANAWSNRLNCNFESYDYLVFDIAFSKNIINGDADKQAFVIWMGINHVVMIKGDGKIVLYENGDTYKGSAEEHERDNCLEIYDLSGKRVTTGALKQNVRYTFVFNLAHKGRGTTITFGTADSLTMYYANMFVCTAEYKTANPDKIVRPGSAALLAEATLEKSLPETFTLDLSGYPFAEEIKQIMWNDSVISEESNPVKIKADWVSTREAGIVETKIVLNDGTEIVLNLTVTSDVQFFDFYTLAGAKIGEYDATAERKEFLGFKATDKVMKYVPANTDHWANRTEVAIIDYDYLIYDWAFEADIFNGNVNTTLAAFYINGGGGHVLVLQGNGYVRMETAGGHYGSDREMHALENCIRIYDSEGNAVRGALKPNTKYTFVIDLSHAAKSGFYNFGVDRVTNFYFANSYFCAERYYRNQLASFFKDEPYLVREVEISVPSTYAVSFDGFTFKDNIEGIYVNDAKVSAANVLNAEWVKAQSVGKVTAVVKLENGKQFELLLVLNKNVTAAAFSAAETSTGGVKAFEGADKTAIGFGASDEVYQYTSASTDWYACRLSVNASNYDYFKFDFAFADDFFDGSATQQAMIIRVGRHIVRLRGDGHMDMAEAGADYGGNDAQHTLENCVAVYDADGNRVVGKLLNNTKYTFVVNLHHSNGNNIDVGIECVTTMYFANLNLYTAEYWQQNLAAQYPENSAPTFEVETGVEHSRTLDLIYDNVEGIYVDDQKISQANVLNAEWVAVQPAGYVIATVKYGDNEEAEIILKIIIGKSQVDVTVAGETTPGYVVLEEVLENKQELGFQDTDKVIKYTSAAGSDHWSSRARFESENRWLVFDFMLTQDMTGTDAAERIFIVWINRKGSYETVLDIRWNGSVVVNGRNTPDDRIKIYDSNGVLVKDTLKKNTLYTIEIDFESFGGKGSAEFGYCLGATQLYYVNVNSCSEEYYKVYRLEKFQDGRVIDCAVEAGIESTHTLDFSAYDFGEIENIYYNAEQISVGNRLNADWLLEHAKTTQFVELRLANGKKVGINLTIRLNYNRFQFVSCDASGSEVTDYAGDKTAIGFGANDIVYTYTTKAGKDHWAARLSYSITMRYAVFDMVLTEDKADRNSNDSVAFHVWINGSHVVDLYWDGSVTLNGKTEPHDCLKLYDAQGHAVTGALQKNVKYTLVFDFEDSGIAGTLEPGFVTGGGDPTTIYIGNAYACTAEYLAEHPVARA